MAHFTTLLFLLVFQHLCFDASNTLQNVSYENMLEKICDTFGDGKCPFDDYCYDRPDYEVKGQTCIKCPYGCKKDDWQGSIYESNSASRWSTQNYEKCPKSHKYYDVRRDACTWKYNCPVNSNARDFDNLTMKYKEECMLEKCSKTTERRFQCENDTKCVGDESECNICTSTHGGSETVCTNDYCEKLSLSKFDRYEFGDDHKYIKCPLSGKCILQGQWCNGFGDCPGNEDEMNCNEEDCRKLNKLKCPLENKCIERMFACSDSDDAKYYRNRCKFNTDCIQKCQEQEGTKFFCPHSRRSTRKDEWMEYNCLSRSDLCNNPDENMTKFLNLSQKLWRCSLERNQYIPTDKVCDGQVDCLLYEDESENTCKRFSIAMAMSYSSAVVSGIVVIMICLKSFSLVNHKFMCKECLKKYAYLIENKHWIIKKRLLTMLIGGVCKEFVTSNNIYDFMSSSLKEQRQAYSNLHHNSTMVKPMLKYIAYRFEQTVTFQNLTRVMNQRQQTFEKIYNFEIHCHDGDERSALMCLYKNQAGNIVDMKEKPTIFTKANLYIIAISKRIFKTSIVQPTIKMSFFVFDLTKDFAFLIYLYDLLFNEESKARISSDDQYLYSIYVISLVFGQILLSVFCFIRRYSTASICSHEVSLSTSFEISTIMIVLFPLTGIIMSTNSYMDDRLAKELFEKISKGSPTYDHEIQNQEQIDWSIGPIHKREYEIVITRLNYTEEQKCLGGFESMKVLESLIESFTQIMLVLIMFNQLPHEGILNESIFAFSTGTGEETIFGLIKLSARNIFILTSLLSYFFIATGAVSYINILEDGSLTMKEKLFMILIYLMQVSISLATSSLLILKKSDIHENFGILIWLTFLGMKFLLLFALTSIIIGRTIFESKTILLLAANLNAPIQLRKFLQISSKDNAKLDRCFLVVWILCGMENIARLICTYAFSSEEIFFKMFSPFAVQSFASLLILLEFSIVLLWRLFFGSLYLWRNLITPLHHPSSRQGLIQDAVNVEDGICIQSSNDELEIMKLEIMSQHNSQESKLASSIASEQSKSLTNLERIWIENTTSATRRKSVPCFEPKSITNARKLDSSGKENDENQKVLTDQSVKNSSNPMWKWKNLNRKAKIDAISAFVLVILLAVCLYSILTDVLRPSKVYYKDCYEINIIDKQKDGLYELALIMHALKVLINFVGH